MADDYVLNNKEYHKICDDAYSARVKYRIAHDEAMEAADACEANPTNATIAYATTKLNNFKKAIPEVERTYKLYRETPREADAHEVGAAAELAFKEWV